MTLSDAIVSAFVALAVVVNHLINRRHERRLEAIHAHHRDRQQAIYDKALAAHDRQLAEFRDLVAGAVLSNPPPPPKGARPS